MAGSKWKRATKEERDEAKYVKYVAKSLKQADKSFKLGYYDIAADQLSNLYESNRKEHRVDIKGEKKSYENSNLGDYRRTYDAIERFAKGYLRRVDSGSKTSFRDEEERKKTSKKLKGLIGNIKHFLGKD